LSTSSKSREGRSYHRKRGNNQLIPTQSCKQNEYLDGGEDHSIATPEPAALCVPCYLTAHRAIMQALQQGSCLKGGGVGERYWCALLRGLRRKKDRMLRENGMKETGIHH
jgi:hypothetical protein